MSIGTSEAQAIIKGKLRKLEESFQAFKRVPHTGTATQWLKSMTDISDAICGAENLLEQHDEHHSRTEKLLMVKRYYLIFKGNSSAEILCLTFNPRKCTVDTDLLPLLITNHALMRMTADQMNMVEVTNKLMLSALKLFQEAEWPVGKSVSLYITDGMFGLVKDKNEDGMLSVIVKTFIRADKFDAGSAHELIHRDVEEGEFDYRPELKDKS
jgi:hypothetical protein